MGKKGKLYLLIVVNLIAWGYVCFKVYTALQGDEDVSMNYEKTNLHKIEQTGKTENEVLSLNYPDPFLKNGNFASTSAKISSLNYSSNNGAKKILTTSIAKATPSVVVQTIDIKYLGLIKNSEKGNQTAMLNFNGKSVFAKQGDVVDGYSVKQINNENIILLKGKEKIVLNK